MAIELQPWCSAMVGLDTSQGMLQVMEAFGRPGDPGMGAALGVFSVKKWGMNQLNTI